MSRIRMLLKAILENKNGKIVSSPPQKADVETGWHPGMAMLVNISHLLIAVNSAINIIVYAIKVPLLNNSASSIYT